MHSSDSDLNAHHVDFTNVTTSAHHTSDAAGIALAALLRVPIPLLILSNKKTVLLANHAAEKLFDLETLDGKTLLQLGIQIAQDEARTQYSWEVCGPQYSICRLELIER